MSQEDTWVGPRSNKEIRKIAVELRAYTNPKRSSPVDIIKTLQTGGIPTVSGQKTLRYMVVEDQEMGIDDANTELCKDIITIRVKRSVHDRAAFGDGRARMTLAHELGHAVLHPGVAKARRTGAVGRPINHNIPAHKSAEHQAKIFASAFLIDQALAENLLDAEAISTEFSISLEAAEIAFDQIQADRGRRESVQTILNLAAEFKRGASSKPVEQLHFMDDNCPNCGEKKLSPIGIKYHCHNCGNTSDAFQDGDRLS